MSPRGCLVLLICLAAPAAFGEERFYPIMGPDGRVQMIRSVAPPEAPEAPEAPGAMPAAPGGGASAEESKDAAVRPLPPAAAPASAAVARPAAPLPHAPYDSDEYVDSEAMDSASMPSSGGRKRFYMVQDGMGQHVSESEATQDGPALPPPAATPAESGARWEALTTKAYVWSPSEASTAMPWLPACIPAPEQQPWPVLVAGEGQGVVVDRPDLAFVTRERVHSGWRLEGEGPRTLLVHSYGRSQRKPEFLDPRLAFLDNQGCVTRVVQGWFDRRYAANDRRHAFLRAELVIHTGEAAVLLLLPPEQDKLAAPGPWQSSRTGQLKFTLKK